MDKKKEEEKKETEKRTFKTAMSESSLAAAQKGSAALASSKRNKELEAQGFFGARTLRPETYEAFVKDKTPTETEVSRRDLGLSSQKEKDIKLKEELERMKREKGLEDIKIRQAQRSEEISNLVSQEQQADTINRMARAGMATISTLLQATGFKSKLSEEEIAAKEERALEAAPIKLALGGIGRVSTAGIGGFSLSSLWVPSSRNVKNLQSDSAALVRDSRAVLEAVKDGADIERAYRDMEILENAIQLRYDGALVSLRESPADIAAGLDLYDSMARDLRKVSNRRFMLERLMATGDPTELSFYLANTSMEDMET